MNSDFSVIVQIILSNFDSINKGYKVMKKEVSKLFIFVFVCFYNIYTVLHTPFTFWVLKIIVWTLKILSKQCNLLPYPMPNVKGIQYNFLQIIQIKIG